MSSRAEADVDELRCVVESGDYLGEGPVWSASEARLYWFDIQGRRLNWLAPADGATGRFELPVRASVAAPCAQGGLVLVTEAGLAAFDTGAGRFELRQPMAFEPGFRTNDGKIDLAGRLWWSTMDDSGGKRPGVLYRTDPDGRTHLVQAGLHIANTVSCSLDGRTMYLADSKLRTLWTLPIEADGSLGQRQTFASLQAEPAGTFDGSAVDAEGFLWNAQWGAWRIVRYAPDGRIDRIVKTPVQQPSSCAFGGPDLATLYITSARENLSDEALARQPQSGHLFAFDPGVCGLPLPEFAGELAPG
jgi:sugar lactone lactonase YvrE